GSTARSPALAVADDSNGTWAGGPVGSIVAGKNPLPPVVDPGNGEVYVVNYDVSNVTVISAATNSAVAAIATGTQPVSPAVDSLNGAIYLPIEGSSNVSVFAGTTDQHLATIPVPSVPLPLTPTFDPETGDLFVASPLSTTIDVISGSTNSVVAEIHLHGSPLLPTFVNATDELFVPMEGTNNVSVISGSTLAVVANLTVGHGYLQTPAYDPADGDLYFPELGAGPSGAAGAIGVLSTTTEEVLATVPVGSLPETPTIDSESGNVYVANYGSNNVSVISATTDSVMASVPTGLAPTVPAYDSENGDLYVANFGSNNVTVIAGSHNVVVETLPVDSEPESAVYSAAGSSVLIANKGSNTVTVLTDGTLPTYSAAFTESGLPQGTSWTVTLNGVPQDSTASAMSFRFPNGEYSYSVRADAGCVAAQPVGILTIDDAATSTEVRFSSGACPGWLGLTPGQDVELAVVVAALLGALAAVVLLRSRQKRRRANERDIAEEESATRVAGLASSGGLSAQYRSQLRHQRHRLFGRAAVGTAVAVVVIILCVPGFGPNSAGGSGPAPPSDQVQLGSTSFGIVTCEGGTLAIAERIPWTTSNGVLTTSQVILTVTDVDGDLLWSSGAPPKVTASNACAGPLPVSSFGGIAGSNVGFSWYVTLSSPTGAIVAFYTNTGGWNPVSGPWPAPIENGSTLTFICNPSISPLGAYDFEGPYHLEAGLIGAGGIQLLGTAQL
ncbi:MAG TPA: YncE family protein, partial [Acidimicrobiales bacterium]|nr:YncE family protein [Acidimicrobiales bacterium]